MEKCPAIREVGDVGEGIRAASGSGVSGVGVGVTECIDFLERPLSWIGRGGGEEEEDGGKGGGERWHG